LSIANIERDGDELHLDGYMAIANLKLNHPKIASKDVVLNAKFDYRFFWVKFY
jgi:esterase/lipase superfamily enzyme